jgi:hypothetical protein
LTEQKRILRKEQSMAKRLFVLSVLFLVGSFVSAGGAERIMKDDFIVNDDTTGDCIHDVPAMAGDPFGNFVIVWEDHRNLDSLGRDIYGQRYNSSGDPLGSNFRVNDDTGDAYQECPCYVATDCSGRFLVTFEDHRTPDFKDHAQWYDSSGSPIGSNFAIDYNSDSAAISWGPGVIGMDSSGNYVLAWGDERHYGWPNADIYAQRYNSSNLPIGDNIRVSEDVGGAFRDCPTIAMNSSGNFVIVWEDGRRNGSWNYTDIYAQRYNSSGDPLGSNFRVNDDFGIDYAHRSSAVAMGTSGNFVVTWADERNGNSDIYAQRYDSLGSAIDTNFKVNDDVVSADQESPNVAMDNAGNFVIVWGDYRNGNGDIYAQRFNSDGNPIESNYSVPNPLYSSFEQSRTPQVATIDSNIYYVWQDDRRGYYDDIYAKVVDWDWNDEVEEGQEVNVANSFELSQNYPNPFNPTTTIRFTVYGSQFAVHGPIHTTLRIYNIKGELVRTLVDEEKTPGNYSITWDGKDQRGRGVSSGVYFYRIKSGEFEQSKKMVLIK